LAEVARDPYPASLQEQDRQYVLKKLDLSEVDFERIMSSPRKTFRDYANNYELVQRIKRLANHLRARGWYAR
jgi:hypothetical protein